MHILKKKFIVIKGFSVYYKVYNYFNDIASYFYTFKIKKLDDLFNDAHVNRFWLKVISILIINFSKIYLLTV